MAATIKDIAANAGVSIATVSNVLNGKRGEYADETRSRVIEAARVLGYHRNRVASSLVRRHSECLGVAFVDQPHSLGENYYLVEVLDGIVSAAYEQGFNVSLHTRLRPDHEAEQLPDLLDRRIDALFLIAPHQDSPLIPLLAASPLPFVVIGLERPYAGVPWIDVDNAAGARLAARHLLSLGHRHVAHIVGHPRQQAAQTRAIAFRSEIVKAGGFCDLVTAGQFKQEEGRLAARELLGKSERPTAIFAANDAIALGALQAAEERRLRVPDHVSIVGFDDRRDAAIAEPPLTTIRQPMRQIGRQAAEWMMDRLRERARGPLFEAVAPELILRSSTAPPSPR